MWNAGVHSYGDLKKKNLMIRSKAMRGQCGSSVRSNTCCSGTGPDFLFHHPYDGSQSSISPVIGDVTPSSDTGTGHAHGA